MDIPGDPLVRDVAPEELADYRRDGAAVLRGILPMPWIEALREATDRLMAAENVPGMDFAGGAGPRFFTLVYPWRLDPVHRAWALHGPGVELARQVLAPTTRLNLYFDQIFAREVEASKVTPFHQDQPYTSLTGSQVLRIWVPLDVVDTDNGAVHYLKGSHLGPVYRARSFADANPVGSLYDAAADFEALPDFAAEYDRHEWLVGSCVPGDAILHHPRTVHGSPANTALTARRATTVMYTGEDVRWAPHPGAATNNVALMGHVELPDLAPGDRLDSDLFPVVWGD
jgi:ectoine hydroxylase-related dioxygenase (phytanoyl-CoA dioxygenase family)